MSTSALWSTVGGWLMHMGCKLHVELQRMYVLDTRHEWLKWLRSAEKLIGSVRAGGEMRRRGRQQMNNQMNWLHEKRGCRLKEQPSLCGFADVKRHETSCGETLSSGVQIKTRVSRAVSLCMLERSFWKGRRAICVQFSEDLLTAK